MNPESFEQIPNINMSSSLDLIVHVDNNNAMSSNDMNIDDDLSSEDLEDLKIMEGISDGDISDNESESVSNDDNHTDDENIRNFERKD